MSRENVEVVRRVLGEISDRLDVSPEHFDPDFVMDMSEIADIGIQRGLPAAREVFRPFATTFDDFRHRRRRRNPCRRRAGRGRDTRPRTRKGERRGGLEPLLRRMDLPGGKGRSHVRAYRPGASPRSRRAGGVGAPPFRPEHRSDCGKWIVLTPTASNCSTGSPIESRAGPRPVLDRVDDAR
jgi:hypothetical protein